MHATPILLTLASLAQCPAGTCPPAGLYHPVYYAPYPEAPRKALPSSQAAPRPLGRPGGHPGPATRQAGPQGASPGSGQCSVVGGQAGPGRRPPGPATGHRPPATDPSGFVGILNGYRAGAGLPPVAYDATLSAWASANNAAQSRRGLGHWVNPNCYQNSGWNYPTAASVAAGWMASPAHRANMLARGVSRVGIAHGPGPYWTLNLR